MAKITIKRPRSDRSLIITYFFLVLTGLLMINSVAAPPEGYAPDWAARFATPVGKQFLWAVLSLGAWFVINYVLDRQTWVVGAYPIYALTLLLLVLVLVIGKEINGARSWFSLAGLTFQPGELAKFGACLAMAAFLSQYTEKLGNLRNVALGFLIWMLPAALILLQPDLGSMLVFGGFLLVMYREGLTPLLLMLGVFSATMLILGILFPAVALSLILLVGANLVFALVNGGRVRHRWLWLLATLVLAALAWEGYHRGLIWQTLTGLGLVVALGAARHLLRRNVRVVMLVAFVLGWGGLLTFGAEYTFDNLLMSHHRERLDVWLRPARVDPQGAGYNVLQSKLAIAAGGLSGKGLQNGTMTKYDYVPEQLTDFIFTAVGEEQGFFGTSMVIVAFLIMLWRITVLAERQRRTFTRAYAYSFAGIILVHFLGNIGMTMGLIPVVGIPLPFISKGGSSLLSFTIMLAVLLKLDKHRDEV